MNRFSSEYFILLTDTELNQLVTAKNRDDFQPDLKGFLYATRKLKELRLLSFTSKDHEWNPPELSLHDGKEIKDSKGNVRGFQEVMLLPARPGEAQMGLCYDWFWSEFGKFLHEKNIWSHKYQNELICVYPQQVSFVPEEEWKKFWEKISSKEHLEQSLAIFLDNKTLFKNQAKPWDSNDIPILSEDMANYLIEYYNHGKSRKRLFKQGSISKSLSDLEDTVRKGSYSFIPLQREPLSDSVSGGDFDTKPKHIRCASCGEIIDKKKGLERLAIFLKDSDERPQSGSHKDQKNRYCKRCVATVFLCPVKLAPETLTVRFNNEKSGNIDEIVSMELRKYVAQTLHIHAGNFVSLHLTESVDRKPLGQIFGAYHYSLWKMGVTFPPELFVQNFTVDVYPGEEMFNLPNWALWFVSSLCHWDKVFEYNCYSSKDNRPHFSQFLRLVTGKKIFQAFYVLIAGNVINDSYINSWKINALQEIWSGLENVLKQNTEKEEDMPIPNYPKIAGFAGLLLPLAERVQSAKKEPNEKKRAIGKLLEEVDRPVQYAYTAARETGSPDFIFCKRPQNRYFFEKAMELLAWAGEDVENLKKEGEEKAADLAEKDPPAFSWMNKSEQKIFIGPDQITRVTSALVSENEKPYENEADWRAFAYQVKLALWSMFPRYLGSQD